MMIFNQTQGTKGRGDADVGVGVGGMADNSNADGRIRLMSS